ncbi:MAG TPA: rhomboid family intramembrane serine protease [Ferruginibacter sp.]|nr:rhomboid family intramembrane serine protease [Ferruginibacter sp.]HPH91767.1 rhomboid family intramembrane serine protease [Ferruginibacter sp.]
MNEFALYPVTYTIIIITVGISLMAFNNNDLKYKLIFYPYGMNKPEAYYRFISYGFIHADYMHLFFNLFTLYSFGRMAEAVLFNQPQYIIFYLSALVASTIFDFVQNRNNSGYAALGASGAVSAVVFSTIIMSPWHKNIVLFGIPALALPNIVFAILYLVYCAYMAKRGGDNIGHNAHLWGSLYGFAFTGIIHPDKFVNFFYQLTHPVF